jgi:hypothetical protein
MTNSTDPLRALALWSTCSDDAALADVARGNRGMSRTG